MARDLEAGIEAHGRAILQAAGGRPALFDLRSWQGKMLDWAMRDEAFKVQLFRFVDVLPSLTGPSAVLAHLREYFDAPDQVLAGWLRVGLRSLGGGGWLARQAADRVTDAIERMAATFIAGATPAEAVPQVAALRSRGIAASVALLGEESVSETEAVAFGQRYLELIERLADAADGWPDDSPSPAVGVSIKVSSLAAQLDPAAFDDGVSRLTERLVPLLARAAERGVAVTLDMEHRLLKDLTLATFRAVLERPELADYEHAGIAVQAYLTETEDDLRELVGWAHRRRRRIGVRLVKGAYWDYETVRARENGWPVPVQPTKADTDACFERCCGLLLDHHQEVGLAVGSHNVRSIAAALAAAEQRGLPPTAVELQMLYGMADPLQDAVVESGCRLRSYVPVGELVPGMAYLVRRLLENTSNEGFLRARFAANQAPDELLRAPQPPAAGDRPEPTTDGFRNEPQPDFSRPEQRRSLAAALGTVRGALGVRVPLLIGGDWRETSESLPSVNPARPEEVAGVAACAGAEEAEEALAAAEDAASWGERPVAERADRLRALAGLLRRDRWELAATVVLEVGKGWRDAAAEVGEAIDFCEYYAQQAERQLTERRLGDYPGELNHGLPAPLGPGVVIAPWNFPLAILTGMATAAVVAGNPVLLKPAEQSPTVAWKLTRLVQEAGFPSGVVQLLPGRGEEVGRYLVAHPRTRFVAFTGSRAVGLEILRAAHTPRPGEVGVKRVVCEMGGKNAIIVDADADLDLAVQAVLGSAFGYQGQKCSACSRVIVLPDNAPRFLDRLVEAARTLRYGPPEDPACNLGPVIDQEALERIREAAEEGRRDGRVLCWRDPPGEGWYPPLVMLDDLSPDHRLVQEELFGPLLVVQRATDFEHALALANGTSYALTGGLISRSSSHLAVAKARFAAGNLYLNRGITGALVGRQPFGGYRCSGLGAHAGGADYLTQFVIPRVISENTIRRGFAPELAAGAPSSSVDDCR